MNDFPEHGLSHGENPKDGQLVAVAEVVSGLACGLVCPLCTRRLVAKKGPVVRHHFAHEADDLICVGARETLLHKLAKQIIAEAKGIWLPPLVAQWGTDTSTIEPATWLDLDHVALEIWKGGIRPDIIGKSAALDELAIEVQVTHACGPEKLEAIERKQLATIEIDLSRSFVEDQIHEVVLRDAPRRWLFNTRIGPEVARLQAAVEAKRARLEALERELEEERRAEDARHLHELRLATTAASDRWRSAREDELRLAQAVREDAQRRAVAQAESLETYQALLRQQVARARLERAEESARAAQAAARLQAGLLESFRRHHRRFAT